MKWPHLASGIGEVLEGVMDKKKLGKGAIEVLVGAGLIEGVAFAEQKLAGTLSPTVLQAIKGAIGVLGYSAFIDRYPMVAHLLAIGVGSRGVAELADEKLGLNVLVPVALPAPAPAVNGLGTQINLPYPEAALQGVKMLTQTPQGFMGGMQGTQIQRSWPFGA